MLHRGIRGIALLAAVATLLVMTATSAFAATTFTLSGGLGGSQECNSSEFHFVINGLESENVAPSSVLITFRKPNGTTQQVSISREKFTGKVAHYTISVSELATKLGLTAGQTLNVTVVSGTATSQQSNVSYNNFNFSHGPCAPVIPEVPATSLYPLVGVFTLAGGFGLRRLIRFFTSA